MMRKLHLLRTLCLTLAALAAATSAAAQDESADLVAGYENQYVAITGATIHTQPGEVIEHGTVLIRGGLIQAVGADVEVPPGALLIEAEGLVVYAGFIDAGATHLINEDGVPAPPAGREIDFERYALAENSPDQHHGLWPHVDVLEHLGFSDEQQQNYRSEGVTVVHIVRAEPILGGQTGIVTLSGRPYRETRLKTRLYQFLQLAPPNRNGGEIYPVTIMGAVAHFRQRAIDALYCEEHCRLYEQNAPDVQRPASDEVLEAMLPMLHHDQRTLLGADARDGIHRVLDTVEEHDLDATLLGGRDSWRVADRLAALEVPVLLELGFGGKPDIDLPEADSEDEETEQSTDSDEEDGADEEDDFEPIDTDFTDPVRLQQEELEQWQQRIGNAQALHDAGVPFAFASNGMDQPQNLLKQVRVLIEEGLPVDVALDGLTRSPAELLGLGDRLGTVQPGRLAHLVVLTGPLEDERSVTRFTLVDGRVFEFNEDAKPVEDEAAAEDDVPATNFAGIWTVTLTPGVDAMTTATIELQQDGENVTGTFSSDFGDGAVEEAAIEGETLRFKVRIGAGNDTLEFDWEGTLAEEDGTPVLTGEVHSPFASTTPWRAVLANEPEGSEESEEGDETEDEDVETEDSGNPVTIALESEEEEEGDSDEAIAAAVALDLPTELESDRLDRGITTGGNVFIRAGTVWTAAGETLENVSIIIRDGKIAEIGSDLSPDEGMTEIDGSEWFVMPGMIDTHSHIMIAGGVNEYSQSIVCEVGIRDVVMSNDPSEYRALAGGLTTARLLHGSANVIGGQDAIVKLRYGLTPAEHVLWDSPQGVKFALGENVKHESGRFPATRMGVEATLQRAFFEALDYRRRWQEYRRDSEELAEGALPLLPPRRDLRLETLMEIVNQEAFIHCHCYRADEILMLLRTAESLGVRIQSLQHVLEGYKIAPEILAHGASCSTFADWWAYKIEAYDATPYNTTLLNEAGINTVVKSDDAELMRHMNLEAAKSLRYGNMPPDDALSMVTINPARELGLDDRIGSIEVGKDGDLAIFNGNPLSPFSRCELTIIDGEVYFNRAHQPTAMSAQGQERSSETREFELAPSEVRERILELPEPTGSTYAVVGATIHPVDARNIRDGVILVKDGLIEAVGSDLEVPEGYAVIDASGMHVYPGLIDAGTTLGITEIEQIGKTHDYSESGGFQPDVRAGTAVNVDSELIPVARAGGVTLAFLRPTGGVIAGQCSLMQTAGWTSPEMIVQEEAGLSLNWQRGGEQEDALREFLEESRRYDAARQAEADGGVPVIVDPRYEEMRPYINGELPVFIEANTREDIAGAVNFAQEENLKIVITGGADAWKLADELSERDISVIVGPTMREPIERWDPFDATYANAGRLHEAGVQFCFRSNDASNSRNVSFEAAISVAYGLPARQALRAVTLSSARILGVADRYGSITPGKVANLVISDGLPLLQTSQIKGVMIEGRPYSPESRQTRFYERYRQRLETVAEE
jgi:imidazolonepropionase-like amidohydrolase